MALVERLAILIDANSSGATREFRKLSAEAGATDKKLSRSQVAAEKAGIAMKTLGTLAGGVALAGMSRFAQQSLDAASALEEVESKAQVVFGQEFARIKTFAEDTASSLNLSERAAYQFASAFGQLFDSAGLDSGQTAEFSERLTTLAADLASFNDISVDEAFQKLRSGLSGEAEPLRNVGVFLSAAKVEAEAYSSGIADVGDELTEAEKVQARYNIILKETATAQGDVARTAESYANKQRSVNAELEDLKANIGGEFQNEAAGSLGALDAFLGLLNETADKANDSGQGLTGFASSYFRNFNPAIGAAIEQLGLLDEFLAEVSGENERAEQAQMDHGEAIRFANRAAADAAPSIDEMSQSVEEAEAEAEAAAEAIEKLKDAIEAFGDEAIMADAAQDALTEAIKDAKQPFRDLRDARAALAEAQADLATADSDAAREAAKERVEREKQAVAQAEAALTLDGNSDAALKNRDALRDLATQAGETAAVFSDGTAEGAEKARRATKRARDEFVDTAIQMGLTKAEAKNLADEYGLIPGKVGTRIFTEGIPKAMEDVWKYKGNLDGIPRNVSTVITTYRKQAELGGSLSGDQSGLNKKRASGGGVGPGTYLIGENGPELLHLTSGVGRVDSNAKTGPMLAGANNSRSVTVHGDLILQTPDPSRAWDSLNTLAVAQV